MKTFIKLLIVVLFVSVFKVNALTVSDVINEGGNMLPGEYVVKQKNSIRNFQTMNIITRQSDGHFVYCLEPDVFVNEIPITGYDHNHANYANLSSDIWNRVMLLSYYGYGYQDQNINHTDSKWYVVTQFMIWKSVPTEQDIFFTDTLNGNRITKYENEIQEMETLLNKHNKLPSFHNRSYQTSVGKTLKIIDTNSVLNGYKISTSNGINAKINDDSLILEPSKTGKYVINLTKNNNIYGVLPIVYVDANTQNVLFRGDVPNNTSKLTIEVSGGTINVNKKGETLNEDIPLEGIKLAIFNDKDQKISEIITDQNGKANYSNLEIGSYYLKEIQTLENYVLDENKYPFQIIKNKLNISLDLKNFLAKGTLEFSKEDFSTSKGLPNTKIDIYTEDNTLFYSGITDKNGKIIIKDIPIGKYYIIEKEAPKGYILNPGKMEFTIKENNEIVKSTMKNKIIMGTLDFTKTDMSTGKVIPNCTITIYQKDTNQIMFRKTTDENGKIIINNIPYGKYYFMETNAPKGYKLNPHKMEFEIKENGEIIKSSLTNEVIAVPDTISSNHPILIGSIIMGLVVLYKIKSKQAALVCFLLILSFVLTNNKTDKVLNLSNYLNINANSIPVKTNDASEYLAYLKIPKIGLYKGITLNEKQNNVDKNIEVLSPSLFPDYENSNLILAGHSGSGKIAFFKDLYKLNVNDTIYLYYQNKTYKYVLQNIYEIDKTGYANIQRDSNKTTLTLITCKNNENKQIVFIAYLQNISSNN